MTEKLDLGEQSTMLEKFTVAAEQYITKKLAREFAIRPRVHVSESLALDALILAGGKCSRRRMPQSGSSGGGPCDTTCGDMMRVLCTPV